jgi:hypothetical protein
LGIDDSQKLPYKPGFIKFKIIVTPYKAGCTAPGNPGKHHQSSGQISVPGKPEIHQVRKVASLFPK